MVDCTGKSTGGQSAEAAAAAAASAEGQDASLVRAPVKHVLSQELQLYFDRVAHLLRVRPGTCHCKYWQPVCCQDVLIQMHKTLGVVVILAEGVEVLIHTCMDMTFIAQ